LFIANISGAPLLTF